MILIRPTKPDDFFTIYTISMITIKRKISNSVFLSDDRAFAGYAPHAFCLARKSNLASDIVPIIVRNLSARRCLRTKKLRSNEHFSGRMIRKKVSVIRINDGRCGPIPLHCAVEFYNCIVICLKTTHGTFLSVINVINISLYFFTDSALFCLLNYLSSL